MLMCLYRTVLRSVGEKENIPQMDIQFIVYLR